MILELDGVSASYGEVAVLHDINLTVGEGEIVALLGANAAGKTTMMKTISGVGGVRHTGRINFLGKDLRNVPAFRRPGFGLVQVPESRRLFAHMTVRENLMLGAFSRKAGEKQSEALGRVMDLFPILSSRSEQTAGSLSGGEQQMCAIGRGLMTDPKLLMIDEPTLGLAPLIVEEIFQLVTQIRDQGIAVLLVEQNAIKSLAVCDRAYVLERGAFVMQGTPSELMDSADDLRRAYIGL